MSPGAAMTPGERVARDEAKRLTLMTVRLTRQVESLRAAGAALSLALERQRTVEVEAVAEALSAAMSGGLCHLGRVCELCDCFADADGGVTKDADLRKQARTALDYVRRRP